MPMQDPGTDPRSKLCSDIILAGTYDALVAAGHTPDSTRKLLGDVTPDQLFAFPIISVPAAYACLAGLWLWLDGLSESHEIAQKNPADLARFLHQTPSKTGLEVQSVGSMGRDKVQKMQQLEDTTASLAFWHAIMHRREGDFSNAKYWYARCRHHPALAPIAAAGRSIITHTGERAGLARLVRVEWDPAAFVDVVEAIHHNPQDPLYPTAVALQQAEWQALFAHCANAAADL